MAHGSLTGLISFTPPACKPAARKGCEDISPGVERSDTRGHYDPRHTRTLMRALDDQRLLLDPPLLLGERVPEVGAVGGDQVHAATVTALPDVGSAAMRRGVVGLAAALVAALALPAGAQAQGAAPSKRCDFTDPAVCLFPWPNDLFTKRDDTTPTGKRLHLRLASMLRNKDGVPIDPTDINRADGFSPGSADADEGARVSTRRRPPRRASCRR